MSRWLTQIPDRRSLVAGGVALAVVGLVVAVSISWVLLAPLEEERLGPPERLQGTPFQIRIPTLFENAYFTPDSPVPEVRKEPGFALEGLRRTYEGRSLLHSLHNVPYPYYMYVAVLSCTESPDALERIRSALKETRPIAAAPLWEDVVLAEDAATEGTWKRLRLIDKDHFFLDAGETTTTYSGRNVSGAVTEETTYTVVRNGLLEIYAKRESDHVICIVWRLPPEVADEITLDVLAPLVASSITTDR